MTIERTCDFNISLISPLSQNSTTTKNKADYLYQQPAQQPNHSNDLVNKLVAKGTEKLLPDGAIQPFDKASISM